MEDNAISTRNGTDFGYIVEVRAANQTPYEMSGVIIYPTWQRAEFKPAEIGVPTQLPDDPLALLKQMIGVMSQQAARALAMWMHAAHGENIRTRIRKHRIEYSYKVTDEGWLLECDGKEDASEPQQELTARVWTFNHSINLDDLRTAGWEPAQGGEGARSGSSEPQGEENGTPAAPGSQSSANAPQ